jgi:GcrA cell cycle regulator
MVPFFPNFRSYSNSDYQKSSLTLISEYQKLSTAPSDDKKQGQTMESTNWAPEHSAALREHLTQGLSYSEIARAINATFGTTYSRNAALGRAKRMGLGGAERPRDWARLPPRAEQPSLHKVRERYAAMSRWFVPVFEPVELPKLRCADVEPRHLSLLELESGDCHYPYGGDEEGEAITFCGRVCREGSSYCTAHFQLTRGPGVVPARVASRTAPRVVEAA